MKFSPPGKPTTTVLFFCLLLSASIAVSQSRWQQKEFVLGTFYDPPIDIRNKNFQRDSASFALAKNAYFNLLTGTQGDGFIDHSFEGMKYSLRLAAAVGLKYLVTDNRIYEGFEKPYDSTVARQVVKDYQALPLRLRNAHYGYFLCDEPQFKLDHVKNVTGWNSIISRLDPGKLILVNYAPSYSVDGDWGGFSSGNSDGLFDSRERTDYELYLATYIKRLNPSVISFDHYPFLKDGTTRTDYFYNLNIIRSKSPNSSFWACPITIDHLPYANPTEAHIRFMYFCPIAYGAKGLCVFSFYPIPNEGYGSALFDPKGNRTERYETVKQLNLYVSQILAPVVMRVPNTSVYHASVYPFNQTGFDGFEHLSSSLISSITDSRIVVGVFRNLKELYLFVVNKDLNKLHEVGITLRLLAPKVFLAPSVVGFASTSSRRYQQIQVTLKAKKGLTTFAIPELEGGEGRMVKVGM